VELLVHAIAGSKPELLQNIVIRRILDHHTLPPEAATVFNRTQPKLAVYTHFVLQQTRTVPPPTIEEIVAETRRTYSGPLQAGEDLMSFDVTDAGVKINVPPR
jgi:ribonuclease Z